jgi:hypothetical protein
MPTGTNQACTVSRQATGDSTNLPSIQYCGRFQRNSGQTGVANALNPSYNLETLDSIRFAGKVITFSFYARAGANFSQASNALGVVVVSGTGTDQNLQNGYTSQSAAINSSATLTTTWQRFTFTSASAVSSTATQLGFYFPWQPVGTAGAADYFEITGIQIDVGSVALPYRTYAGTIQGELSAAQRYYYRQTIPTAAFAGMCAFPFPFSTTRATFAYHLPVPMRVAPTALDQANIAANRATTDTRYSSGTWALGGTNGTNNQVVEVFYTHGSAVFTQGDLVFIQSNNASNQFIGFSAEL